MNEVWNVLTYRDYDFEDNGRHIEGRTLHCYRPNSHDGWPGVEYAKLAVNLDSDAYRTDPVIGAAYVFTFDRRGKVIAMSQAEDPNA